MNLCVLEEISSCCFEDEYISTVALIQNVSIIYTRTLSVYV